MKKVKSKRSLYRQGVNWIAGNDRPGAIDASLETLSNLASVSLLAHLYNKTVLQVAKDVKKKRDQYLADIGFEPRRVVL